LHPQLTVLVVAAGYDARNLRAALRYLLIGISLFLNQ
jgi:hypothetical protein